MKCIVRNGYFYGQEITVNRSEKFLKMYAPGEEVELPDGTPLPHQLELKTETDATEQDSGNAGSEEVKEPDQNE